MRLWGLVLAAAVVAASIAPARAEGVEIDCKETNLKFEASTFKVTCKDYSRSTINLSEISAASRTYTLLAMSEAELSFMHVLSNHVLGGTRIYLKLSSLEGQIEDNFGAKLSNWGDEEDIGDYEVKHVTAVFKNDDPVECLAFRKLAGRRGSGVSGVTVGFSCSADSRDKAMATMKSFIEQDD